jgi:hypothetical protein
MSARRFVGSTGLSTKSAPARLLAVAAAALSAYARAEDRTRALTAGFQTHVPTPVDPAELVPVVQSVARWTNLDRPDDFAVHLNGEPPTVCRHAR